MSFYPNSPRRSIKSEFSPAEKAQYRPAIVERNTFKYTRDTSTVIRLHQTDILTFLIDGRVQLNSGGYRTVTTKDRLNKYLKGYQVHSVRGVWMVRRGDWETGEAVPFYDGMILPDAFENRSKADRALASETKARALIKRMLAQLDRLDALPQPNSGDCWLCLMRDKDGKSWGAHAGPEDDREHVRGHVREGYLHGSLIMNAMAARNYGNLPFVWGLATRDWKGWRSRVKRDLRRYLNRAFGLPA